MNENEAKGLFRQAADVYKDGDYKDALKLFDRLDAAFPGNVRIMYPRARCLVKLERFDEAVAVCDILITKFGHADARALKAQVRPDPTQKLAVPPIDENTAFDPLDLNAGDLNVEDLIINEGLPSAFDMPRGTAPARNLPSPKVIGAVVVGILVVLVGVYGVFGGGGDSGGGDGSSVPSASSPGAMPPIDTSVEPELITAESSDSSDGVTVNASVEYGVWTNCGSYDAFLAKYAACEPAAIRMSAMGMFVVEYRVLGAQDGVCQIEMKAVEAAIYEGWGGKSMTCPCDNSMDFIKLTEQLGPMGILDGTLNCEGPLYDAMMETFGEYQQ
jgi:hypothetical protein